MAIDETRYIMLDTNNAGADFVTEAIDIRDFLGFAIQLKITSGTPSGTITIESSCDVPTAVTNWVTVRLSESLFNTDNSPLVYNCDAAFYTAMRVKYTRTSGTGNVAIRIHLNG